MSFFKAKPLPHKISCDPEIFFDWEVIPDKTEKVQEINDEYFVLNMARGLTLFKIFTFGLGGLILFITSMTYFFIKGTPNYVFLYILPAILLGLFHLAVYYYNPQKELVLDRMKGTISYPHLFFSRKQETVPFWLVTVYKSLDTGGDFTPMGYSLVLRDRKQDFAWTLAHNNCEDFWSFMVWYMDKNRPLPFGDIFDPYRQADFERRQKEGFPAPLYPSLVETDEETPEQQAIRRRMVGW